MVNREHMEQWINALESDGYKQCTGSLRWTQEDGHTMHCAEGVAMAVAQAHGVKIHPLQWDETYMPPQVRQWYGINGSVLLKDDDGMTRTIIAINDDGETSFWEIAQLLRTAYLKEEGS